MAFKSPKTIVETAFNIGKAKTELSIPKMLVLGFLAGAFIAFGGLLAIVVGKGVNTEMLGVGIGKFIFGGVFPVGLMLVVIAGSELFTGNCGLITPACLAGKAKWSGLLKNWVFVYIGNFIGSLFVAYFLAYATGGHRHQPEMDEQLSRIGRVEVAVHFQPHLVPMDRGILESVYVRLAGKASAKDVEDCWRSAYAREPFIRILGDGLPSTKRVAHTNLCELAVREGTEGTAILFAAIDNLGKGASGQALQNLNIMYGFDETTGLW